MSLTRAQQKARDFAFNYGTKGPLASSHVVDFKSMERRLVADLPADPTFRKVLRKMLGKLEGRHRGYTPPAWWVRQNQALNQMPRTGRISYQGVGKTGKLMNLTEKAKHVDCDCMACLPHTY